MAYHCTIAAAAGVNIAAVNYYFGSKDKLIEESLQSALDHMFSDSFDFYKTLIGRPPFRILCFIFWKVPFVILESLRQFYMNPLTTIIITLLPCSNSAVSFATPYQSLNNPMRNNRIP